MTWHIIRPSTFAARRADGSRVAHGVGWLVVKDFLAQSA
jgi:hypothetical protein